MEGGAVVNMAGRIGVAQGATGQEVDPLILVRGRSSKNGAGIQA